MKALKIKDGHRVARYCGKSKLETDLGSVLHTAFMLDDNRPEISVDWLEYYSSDFQTAMTQIRSRPGLTRGANARYAILNVCDIRDFVLPAHGYPLKVCHTPKQKSKGDNVDNPAHADICGCRCCERDIADELAELVSCLVPAREP